MRRMNTEIADHSEGLRAETVLRQSELVVHLPDSGETRRAARFYAHPISEPALAGATKALARYV